MRIASFNIHHGAPATGPVDLVATAAVIDSLVADVVVVQEVDRRSRRSGKVDQATALGAATGMRVLFAPTIVGRWGTSSGYGIAVLSRRPLRDVEIIDLPHSPSRERRVAIIATVDHADSRSSPITLAGTHLQAGAFDEALEQLDVILARLNERPGPRVLAGDLNLRPHHVAGPLANAGLVPVRTGPSFPADRPTIQIDWLAVSGRVGDEYKPGVEATEGEVVDTQVSDHRPIVAEIGARGKSLPRSRAPH